MESCYRHKPIGGAKMKKKLLLLMSVSTILHGASLVPDEYTVISVRHLSVDGIQGTYIFRNVVGLEDLSARIKPIKDANPELEWTLNHDKGKAIAWLLSYKKGR